MTQTARSTVLSVCVWLAIFACGRTVPAAIDPELALPKSIHGEVFPKGPVVKDAQPLFIYDRGAPTRGLAGRTERGLYTDPQKMAVAVETVVFGPDGKLKSYALEQKQLGAKGSVEIKDGKAKFSYEKDGNAKVAEETATDDLIVAPTLATHLQKHWSELLKGETVRARFAVLDRRETVGFKFAKIGESEENGKKTLKIKMSASSLLVSAMVDPLYFTFTADGLRVLRFEGRTLLKQKIDGAWRDLDAVTVYAE